MINIMKHLLIFGCCLLALCSGCKSKPYQYRNIAGKVIKTDVKPDWWGDANAFRDGMVDEKATKDMIAFQQSMQQAQQSSKAQEDRYKQYQVTPTPDRKQEISRQFDSYDGSHIKLVRYVKEKMNDPKSFEHVKTEYADKGDYIYLEMTFRGKNALGVLVLNKVTAKAKIDGQILEVQQIE